MTNFLEVIKSICMVNFMSHVSNLNLYSKIWSKLKHLYKDTNFIEWDIIFI